MDHAGTTLYPKSLVKQVSEDLTTNLFGNPHSQSPASLLSTRRMENVRSQMLAFFKADPKFYDLVFVSSATAAIKLVAESLRDYSTYRTGTSFWYGYHAAAHTSLVGVRELAVPASTCFNSDQEVEQWLETVDRSSRSSSQFDEKPKVGLFAYPAQSNMNGRRLPLQWSGRLRKSQRPGHQDVYSLLDAAAFVATAPLDLSDHMDGPDFVALSFYKIFGLPDLGALIVRKDAGHVLCDRLYFGGGTVDMIINGATEAWHAKKQTSLHEILEDGTPAFHNIIALESAVHVHQALFHDMHHVSTHTGNLSKVLYDRMCALRHENGAALCRIYKDLVGQYGQGDTQGPTIAFNVQKANGSWIRKTDFENLAILNGIQLRTGGVCNPGGIAWALDLTPAELRENYAEGLRCGNGIDELNGKPTGIIRVSLGAMSSMKDVDAFVNFLHLFVETSPVERENSARVRSEDILVGMPPPTKCSHRQFHVRTKAVEVCEKELQADAKASPLVCPIAACKELSFSEETLLEHFRHHKLDGMNRVKKLRCYPIFRHILSK